MKRTNENLKKYHLKKGLKKFQNADIKHITFNMELNKVCLLYTSSSCLKIEEVFFNLVFIIDRNI